jgi:hypothetical protein
MREKYDDMKRILTTALSALMVLVIMISCSKQGPVGATGPSGSANVIVSPWTGGFSGTSATWFVDTITSTVLDSSVVLVYAQLYNGINTVQLHNHPARHGEYGSSPEL